MGRLFLKLLFDMKKTIFIILVMLAGLVSCKYEDSDIWNAVKSNEVRIAALEAQCRALNQDIQSLNTIVRALQDNDYVTGVVEVQKNGAVVGYTISFSKSGSVTIYNGEEGRTPVIGIKRHADGKYYWTVDGEWIYDGSGTGNRISAEGTVPQLKITDGWWYVSYDEGKSWTKLSKASGEDGESFFSQVTDNGDSVTVVLKDGTTFELAKKSNELGVRFSEYSDIQIGPGETKSIHYEILNGSAGTVVKVLAQGGWVAKVQIISASEGDIVVTAPSPMVDGEVVVLIYDGDSRTVVRCLDFVYGKISVPKGAYSLTRHGGSFVVSLDTSVDYHVTIPEEAASWLSLSGNATRSMRRDELTFLCSANDGEASRSAVVAFENKSLGLSRKIVVTQDGIVHTLQSHSSGNGIKLVIMGDGFTKEDLTPSAGADASSFDIWAARTMEEFFAEEPYRSFRDRFDVYSVAVESDGREFDGTTAFQSKFGTGTNVGGNDTRVFQSAYKVDGISWSNVRNTLEMVILNTSKYAGTTYMWSDGRAIAYIPLVNYSSADFGKVLRHEAGGHGFAKLADEYFYSATITADGIQKHKQWYSYGFYANADVTSDPKSVHWAHLISDKRYSGQVGVYEGALTYRYGAYRPTDYSIMRQNVGGFNAPSREAIYKRIMSLSQGSGWKYDFEAFASYDEINRSASSQSYYEGQLDGFDESTFIPLAPPVLMAD